MPLLMSIVEKSQSRALFRVYVKISTVYLVRLFEILEEVCEGHGIRKLGSGLD